MQHKQRSFNLITRKTQPGKQGQSLVEFALLLPVLVLILVGVFDLGRAFHALITISNAGREAARYGTLHNDILDDPDEMDKLYNVAVVEAASSNMPISADDVNVLCLATGAPPKCPRDTTLQVQVDYTYTPILSFFFPDGVTIHSAVEMRVP